MLQRCCFILKAAADVKTGNEGNSQRLRSRCDEHLEDVSLSQIRSFVLTKTEAGAKGLFFPPEVVGEGR